jgi:hypothetical protein
MDPNRQISDRNNSNAGYPSGAAECFRPLGSIFDVFWRLSHFELP